MNEWTERGYWCICPRSFFPVVVFMSQSLTSLANHGLDQRCIHPVSTLSSGNQCTSKLLFLDSFRLKAPFYFHLIDFFSKQGDRAILSFPKWAYSLIHHFQFVQNVLKCKVMYRLVRWTSIIFLLNPQNQASFRCWDFGISDWVDPPECTTL